MRRTLFLLVALAALTACNPRLYPPQVETPDNYLYAGRFRQDSLAGSEEWWHVFRDPTLDSLISQALANNRDLAVGLLARRGGGSADRRGARRVPAFVRRRRIGRRRL